MAKEQSTEQCSHYHGACEKPHILPCGSIFCCQHYFSVIRERFCPVCKENFGSDHMLPTCLLKDVEEAHQPLGESAADSKYKWFGMGTKRGRERYITTLCEGWLFCDHEACSLNHQKSMGLKRGRQDAAKSNED